MFHNVRYLHFDRLNVAHFDRVNVARYARHLKCSLSGSFAGLDLELYETDMGLYGQTINKENTKTAIDTKTAAEIGAS